MDVATTFFEGTAVPTVCWATEEAIALSAVPALTGWGDGEETTYFGAVAGKTGSGVGEAAIYSLRETGVPIASTAGAGGIRLGLTKAWIASNGLKQSCPEETGRHIPAMKSGASL